MTGILIQNTGNFWVARANRHFTITAPTAHRVIEMLQEIAKEEVLDYSK